MSIMICRDPRKEFGKRNMHEDAAPALLATDYKSPSLVIEIEDEDKEADNQNSQGQDSGNTGDGRGEEVRYVGLLQPEGGIWSQCGDNN